MHLAASQALLPWVVEGAIIAPATTARVWLLGESQGRRGVNQLTALRAESSASMLSGTSLLPTLPVATAPAMVSRL